MKKKYFSYLMAVMMLAVIGSMLGSCGSSKDDADEPGVPDVNPQLDWNFTYETSQTDDGVVIKWKVEEKTKSISEKGETRIFCKPGRDRFFPPEWGDLYEAKQTVSNTSGHDGYVYVWSLHFMKGVLPVILNSGDTTPQFRI